MKKFFAVLTAIAALAPSAFLVMAPSAQAFGIDGQEAQLIICTHSGYSKSKARSCVANVLKQGSILGSKGGKCLITAVGTTFGAVVGGYIGAAEARGIAGAVVGGGAGACLNILLQ